MPSTIDHLNSIATNVSNAVIAYEKAQFGTERGVFNETTQPIVDDLMNDLDAQVSSISAAIGGSGGLKELTQSLDAQLNP